MSNCGTCKFWGCDKDKGEKYRSCSAVIHSEHNYHDPELYNPDDYTGDGDWNADVRKEIESIRKHRAVVVDGSGYYAALKCCEDFGCVLWTPPAKEPA